MKRKIFWGLLVASLGLYLLGPGFLWWQNLESDIRIFQRMQFLTSYSPDQFGRLFSMQEDAIKARSTQAWSDFVASEEDSETNVNKDLKAEILVRGNKGLVYFHGFSASRKELSPILEEVAEAKGASLYFTRMFDHGLPEGRLENLRTADYISHSQEVFWISSRAFLDFIPVGMSTGATQILYALAKSSEVKVKKIVLIAPNLGVKPRFGWRLATGPLGGVLLKVAMGETYAWETKTEQHKIFWTPVMDSQALTEMLQFVALTKLALNKASPQQWSHVHALVIQNPKDEVVDNHEAKAILTRLGFASITFKEIAANNHVLAGDAVTPSNNAVVKQWIADFFDTAVE